MRIGSFIRIRRPSWTLADFLKQYFSYYCTDELPLNPGRKFLHKLVREESARHNFLENSQPTEERDAQKSLLVPKMAVAASGMFVLCCIFLCPCFRARRKQADHTVLTKDLQSLDSVSSLVMNPAPEKIPGSPLRVPGSPLRVPGSPLRVPPSPARFSMSPKIDRIGSVHLNINQVVRATQNFSPSMMLGEGGYGTVYKAQLQDGQIVAIKRAKKEHFEALRTEFSSEVQLLSKIDHRNLVKLLGYLDKGNERLVITEYVPNGTLREHLDGMRSKILDFNQRLEISIDVAHALTYLHLYSEKQIIHRDVKSSNILLTESMRAKVADFGFARLGSVDSDKTHISTKVKGTVGYLDPEYMRTYQLTPKSDVYSFGVVLLEILTGRRPVELKKPADERVTLRWAFKKYDEGNVREIVDPLMQEVVDEDILMKMFELAFHCAAPTRSDRPDMKAVGEQLWAVRMDYLRSGRRG
ncbi:calmodulin-binding receptor-like cytoplasmic kinase 3 isoform X2 [Rhododendron vialii]|uniref:calmodulin-binding receptor-like cytoplasmic kinase 3 isoform X2 n=1 Tax=Rhododendron vialii TaxID=182163 RepID=UPI00265F5D2F|nr:calmodulin-binding receptor-like cytoplasmic kinase 3 isoform X2 [Rhododendron vialii]